MNRRELLKSLVVAAVGTQAKPVQAPPTLVRHYRVERELPGGGLAFISWTAPIEVAWEMNLVWNPDFTPRVLYPMIQVSQEEVLRLSLPGHVHFQG